MTAAGGAHDAACGCGDCDARKVEALVRAIERLPREKQVHAASLISRIGDAFVEAVATQQFRHLEKKVAGLVRDLNQEASMESTLRASVDRAAARGRPPPATRDPTSGRKVRRDAP